MALLGVNGLGKSYGGVRAVHELSFTVEQGSITALIGPNGAGKTTALNCISGVVRPGAGRVQFAGREVTGWPGHRLARLGLTRTFQNLQMFGRMTVLENVMVGLHAATRKGFAACMLRLPGRRSEELAMMERAREVVEFCGLGELAEVNANELAYGDQKRVELARAFACRPKLMLLDEPVAGLNPAETELVGRLIVDMRKQGAAMVLVEHDMALVMKVSDQVVVLSYGEKITQGAPEEVQRHPEVVRIYLGGGEEFGLACSG